jgi:hypothetical protein
LVLADDGVRERRTRVALDSKGSILGFASYLISGNVAVGRIAPHLSSTKHQTVITTLPVAIAAEWMAKLRELRSLRGREIHGKREEWTFAVFRDL